MMRRPRGQTLLLFSLSLLLLTLMVLMTIGLGVRLHERTEQQVVADAAAYSQAVVTARTFNAVASLNRALIAQLSAVAAAQSLLSWAGYYHGALNQGRDVLASLGLGACGGEVAKAYEGIIREDERLIEIWEPQGAYTGIEGHDLHSASYIRRVVYETALVIADDQKRIYDRMVARVAPTDVGRGIAEHIAQEARRGSPWGDNRRELFAADQRVTRRERDAAVVPEQHAPKHLVRATMATRGVEHFISSREATPRKGELSAADYVRIRLNAVMAAKGSRLTAVVSDYGTAYFGAAGPQVTSGLAEVDGLDGQSINRAEWKRWQELARDDVPMNIWGAWAQDSGTFRFEPPPGCTFPEPTEDSFGYIVTTGPDDDRDNHLWRRGQDFDYRERNSPHVNDPPVVRHSFQRRPERADAPSIWPVFVDYQESALQGANAALNLEGQPKSLVPIVRDYSVRSRDPWELRFRFQFSRTGTGTRVDLGSKRAGFEQATAIASALTYYHRGAPGGTGAGHAAEPPNFLNPFWRATLVASDVDERFNDRGNDIIRTLEDVGQPQQAEALRLLRAAQFEAIP